MHVLCISVPDSKKSTVQLVLQHADTFRKFTMAQIRFEKSPQRRDKGIPQSRARRGVPLHSTFCIPYFLDVDSHIVIRQNDDTVFPACMSPTKKLKELLSRKKEKKTFSMWFFLVGIILAGGSAYLVYATPLFVPSAEEILPAQDLAYFANIGEPDCSSVLAEKNPKICGYRSELLGRFFGAYPERLTVFSDSLALAQYKNPISSDQSSFPSILLRIKSPKNAEDFVKSQDGAESVQEGVEEGIHFYRFSEPQKRTILFWRGWLIITQDDEMIQKLVAVKRGEVSSFSKNKEYQELRLLADDSDSSLFVKSEFLGGITPSSLHSFFSPLLDFFPNAFILFSPDKEGISIQLLAKSDSTPQSSQKTEENTFSSLFSALPTQQTLFLAGLHDPSAEIQRVIKNIEESDMAYSLFVYGQLQNLIRDFFGTDISLEYDILPLLQNEIVIALVERETKNEFLMIASTDDPEFVAAKQEKMKNALQNVAAKLVPRVFTHTLEDGTKIQEISGCDECVKIETEALGEAEITTFSAEDEEGNKKTLSLGRINGLLAVSLDPDLLSEALTDLQNKKELPEIISRVSDISKRKEVFALRPSVLEEFGLPFSQYLSDFSVITLVHSEKNGVWEFLLRGEL